MSLAAPWVTSKSGKTAHYYYTNWATYGRNYQVADIPMDKVTDIVYAFFDVQADGTCKSVDSWADFENGLSGKTQIPPTNTWDSPKELLGNLGQFNKLRKSGKQFNLHLSVGGWTLSKNFSPAVSTQDNRQRFVDSLKSLFSKYPGLFNAIDLDWEYLSGNNVNYGNAGNLTDPKDPENVIILLKMLRQQLPGFKLSLCIGAAPEKCQFPVKDVCEHLDFLSVMGYDMSDGNWSETITAHHCNPRKSSFGKWSNEAAADFFISQGVPSEKILIGVAMYSRGFSNTEGIGKPAQGGSSDFEFEVEKGIVPFRMLPRPGATETIDPESKGAYSYDPVKKIVNTYDNPESVREKCRIVFEKKLAGVICWEISGDIRDANSDRSLVNTLYKNLLIGKPADVPVPGNPAPAPAPKPTNPPPTNPVPTPKPTNPNPKPNKPAAWAPWVNVKIGDIVTYNGFTYKCIQAHKTQPDWGCSATPALWMKL